LKLHELQQFRPATADDVPFILELLREFYRKAGAELYKIPFDGPSAIQTIAKTIAHGVCLVGPSSAAGALLCPFPWNRRAIVAQVVFWKFKSHREITIFEALMDACKQAGADYVNATSLFPDHAILRKYQKLGLSPCEIQCLGQLKA